MLVINKSMDSWHNKNLQEPKASLQSFFMIYFNEFTTHIEKITLNVFFSNEFTTHSKSKTNNNGSQTPTRSKQKWVKGWLGDTTRNITPSYFFGAFKLWKNTRNTLNTLF
jgi:hypothetical protein